MIRLLKYNNLKSSVRFFSESKQTITGLDIKKIKSNYLYLANIINHPINISSEIKNIIEDEIEEVDRLAIIASEHALRN